VAAPTAAAHTTTSGPKVTIAYLTDLPVPLEKRGCSCAKSCQSASQATTPATQMIREAVETFITALSNKAEISIVTFGERPTIVVDYTTDVVKLKEGAKRIFPRAGAGAYLMDAIVDVSRGFKKREAKRPVIVVLMMENDVEFSNRHYDNVLKELQTGGGALHVVRVPGGRPRLDDDVTKALAVCRQNHEVIG